RRLGHIWRAPDYFAGYCLRRRRSVHALASSICRDSSSHARLPFWGHRRSRISSVGDYRRGILGADVGGFGRDGRGKYTAASVGEVSLSESHRATDVVVHGFSGGGYYRLVGVDRTGGTSVRVVALGPFRVGLSRSVCCHTVDCAESPRLAAPIRETAGRSAQPGS